MSAEAKLSLKQALTVLRPGPFRRFVLGSSISDTGTWMQMMAQGYIMSTLSTKAIWLGLANLAGSLPMLALTMIGGAAADKYDKRQILLVTQYVQIALAIVLGTLVWTNQIAMWQILVCAAVLGISNSFEMPTITALVPELVKKNEIASAVAIDRAVFHGSRVVGPAVGGLLIIAWGAAWAFFLNAFSFVALIIALLTLPPRQRGTAEEEEKRTSGIKDGFRFVAQDKPSLAMVSLIATTSICIFPFITIMMPLYVRLVMGAGADRFGALMSASAVGSVMGAIFLISLPRNKRIPIMMLCVAVVTCAVFSLSLAPSFHVAMGILVFNSLGLALNFGLANTIVQERAPDYLRGRVSAVFMLSFVGVMPIAGMGITSISDLIGMPKALAFASIVYGVIGMVVLARVLRDCREPGVCNVEAETPPPPPVPAAIN